MTYCTDVRTRLDLTQPELAALAGVSRSTVALADKGDPAALRGLTPLLRLLDRFGAEAIECLKSNIAS